MLPVNAKAPDFILKNQNVEDVSLQSFRGKYVVLYFYPKDDTPGCTTEACGMRDSYENLKHSAVVLGISSDSVQSHKKFAEKYDLPFILLSDPDKKVVKLYEATGGPFTKRITYLIDPNGYIVKSYPKVIPSDHSEELVRDLAEFI